MEEQAVLFDFDGTLCPGDSIVPWLRFCIREGLAPPWQWFPAAGGYFRQTFRKDQVIHAKESTLSFIRGRHRDDFAEPAARFVQTVLAPRIHPEARRLLEDLHARQIRTVVISASPDLYMQALDRVIPVDAIIATRCQVDGEGRYTGRITSNCRGPEKVSRWIEWNGPHGWHVIRAYGDSHRDLPMLSLAETPVLVNPNAKLRKACPEAEVCHW